MFKMNDIDGVLEMYERFTNISSDLVTLGKTYTNVDLVSKFLNTLHVLEA
ncbi:unnamed protein product [Linum tenue]|uniref:Uncharacterized protein n=1 Tax=Linum tenue TaxID=586396 RepID=A0AAV0NSY1_9ROSI|nr:unnamed protein product [Linum tenue]